MPIITIVNDETGVEETWHTRISRQAFGDWVRDRAMLREAGRPDRPPDVDHAGLRAWVAHPGEEDHPYFRAQAAYGSAGLLFPVMSAGWANDRLQADMLVTGHMDGAFTVKVQIVEDGMPFPGVEAAFDPDYPPGAVGEAVEGLLEQWGRLAEGEAITCHIHTPEDFDGVIREMKLAEAELAHVGFFNPLPEGPIQ